jgi:hypothetical protein
MISFLQNNLVEGALITASSENALYPLSNLKHDFRTKVYRSTSDNDSVVFDLGAIEDVDHIAIVDNWRNGFGVSGITIEANGTDNWTAPAFSETITLDPEHGIGIKELSSLQSYRYWRLVLTSTLGYCELAYVFIGKATTLTTNGAAYGFNFREADLKNVSATRYGQEYIDNIGTQKNLSGLKFDVLNKDELDILYEFFDNRRTVKPFVLKFCGDGTIINNANRINGLYKLTSAPSPSLDTAVFWSVTLNLREQK